MMLRTELVLVLFRFIFVRHQIKRDLGHRRAAAEGEEPRGPCKRACAWRACTLALGYAARPKCRSEVRKFLAAML